MDHAWAFLAVCALTNTAFVHQKASKNQGKTLQNALVSKNNTGKDKRSQAKALLSNLLPPPGNREVGELQGILV